jgi:hypothetical protein
MFSEIIYSLIEQKVDKNIFEIVKKECDSIIKNMETNLQFLHRKYKLSKIKSITRFMKKDTDLYDALKKQNITVTYIDIDSDISPLNYYTINYVFDIKSCYNLERHILFSAGGNLGSILSLVLSNNMLLFSEKYKSKCYLFFANKRDILRTFQKYKFKSNIFNSIKDIIKNIPFQYPIFGINEINSEDFFTSIISSSLFKYDYKLFRINNNVYNLMKEYLYIRGYRPEGYYNWVDIPTVLVYHKNLDAIIKKLFDDQNQKMDNTIEDLLLENNENEQTTLFNSYIILTKILFTIFNVPPFLLSLQDINIIRTESRILDEILISKIMGIVKSQTGYEDEE